MALRCRAEYLPTFSLEEITHEIRCSFFVATVGNDVRQCRYVDGKNPIGAKPNIHGMPRKLQFEQFFLCSELRTIGIVRRALYGSVRSVQKRMQWTQIAFGFSSDRTCAARKLSKLWIE
jgi:hypothetical protein